MSAAHDAVPPLPSSTFTLTVYVPGFTPDELQRASGPLPSTAPPDALYAYVRGRLPGLLALTCTATGSFDPAYTEAGLAEQDAVGGSFGAGGGGLGKPKRITMPVPSRRLFCRAVPPKFAP